VQKKEMLSLEGGEVYLPWSVKINEEIALRLA